LSTILARTDAVHLLVTGNIAGSLFPFHEETAAFCLDESEIPSCIGGVPRINDILATQPQNAQTIKADVGGYFQGSAFDYEVLLSYFTQASYHVSGVAPFDSEELISRIANDSNTAFLGCNVAGSYNNVTAYTVLNTNVAVLSAMNTIVETETTIDVIRQTVKTIQLTETLVDTVVLMSSLPYEINRYIAETVFGINVILASDMTPRRASECSSTNTSSMVEEMTNDLSQTVLLVTIRTSDVIDLNFTVVGGSVTGYTDILLVANSTSAPGPSRFFSTFSQISLHIMVKKTTEHNSVTT
jgi:hypothetical protein